MAKKCLKNQIQSKIEEENTLEEGARNYASAILIAREKKRAKAEAEKRKSIRKMPNKELNLADIADFTGFPIEAIEKIKNT